MRRGSAPGLQYLDPEAAALVTVPLPEGAALEGIAAAKDRLYVTHVDGRVWRLAHDGTVLAEARLDREANRDGLFAVAGLGLFVQDDRGRLEWFDEDLANRRLTEGCEPSWPIAASDGLLFTSEPLGGSWTRVGARIHAWRPTSTSATEFQIAAEASYPVLGGRIATAAGAGGLWVLGAELVHLRPKD